MWDVFSGYFTSKLENLKIKKSISRFLNSSLHSQHFRKSTWGSFKEKWEDVKAKWRNIKQGVSGPKKWKVVLTPTHLIGKTRSRSPNGWDITVICRLAKIIYSIHRVIVVSGNYWILKKIALIVLKEWSELIIHWILIERFSYLLLLSLWFSWVFRHILQNFFQKT